MFASKMVNRIAAVLAVLMLTLGSFQPAYAAPGNDNFADATPITGLPFSVNASNAGATFEVDEPTPGCWWGNPVKSIWFTYTASSTVALTVKNSPSSVTPLMAVYAGNSLSSLSQVGCQYFGNDLTFLPQVGVTYYFQLASLFGDEGTMTFALDFAPPPQVQVGYGMTDPNMFDSVYFYPAVYDPVGCCSSVAWTISDGTSTNEYSFYHQFAADGDYTAGLTVTTSDGRTGSAGQVIHVRTYDVSIDKLSVPQSARVNQNRTINVDVKNNRYSGNVTVYLSKGVPGGGETPIGTLTIYVPARATKATTFKFSYTFTPDDATIGKVTFKAVASLVSGRDALPSDNTAISTTLVTK